MAQVAQVAQVAQGFKPVGSNVQTIICYFHFLIRISVHIDRQFLLTFISLTVSYPRNTLMVWYLVAAEITCSLLSVLHGELRERTKEPWSFYHLGEKVISRF